MVEAVEVGFRRHERALFLDVVDKYGFFHDVVVSEGDGLL